LNTPDSIRRFSRSIKRQEQAKHRSQSFKEHEFKVEEHIDLLASHNAKIEL
jgi:hypothetical protein